jgi:Leucine-rich repeat (LRR) protein
LEGHSRLRRLNLACNRLSSLAELPPLPRLEALNLAGNCLGALDLGLDRLPCLRLLNLGQNQIASLQGLQQLHRACSRVEVLLLHNNRINHLHELDRYAALLYRDARRFSSGHHLFLCPAGYG